MNESNSPSLQSIKETELIKFLEAEIKRQKENLPACINFAQPLAAMFTALDTIQKCQKIIELYRQSVTHQKR